MNLIVKENELGQVISARELHEFLEVKRDFTTWVKGRIEKYNFTEGEDFQVTFSFHQNGGKGGRPKEDYLLTLDMAKEVSMIENNEKGRQARKYFIACEKKYVELLENKTSLPNFSQLNYEKGLVYVKGVLNNLKSRLIFEKTEIEIKLKELEDKG